MRNDAAPTSVWLLVAAIAAAIAWVGFGLTDGWLRDAGMSDGGASTLATGIPVAFGGLVASAALLQIRRGVRTWMVWAAAVLGGAACVFALPVFVLALGR